MIIINHNTRQFNVPGADLVFGVSGDSGSEVKHFQCSRYVGNNIDLMSCFVRINFRNSNGKTDSYLVDDMAIDGDNVTFSWLLSPKVTEYRGQVKFVVCAVGPDLKLKWHTTQGTGQVMEGLEPDNSHIESQTADVVAQLIAMVEEQTSTIEKAGADKVAEVNAAAETARMAAVNEIEAKGVNTRNSIPEDYTALSSTVESLARGKAGGIVCHAEGEVITLNDASDNPLRGLRIFGKSTQDGVPTPESPVEIVSVGDGGSVCINVSGKNVFKFTGNIIMENGSVIESTPSGCTVQGVDGGITPGSTAWSNGRVHFDRMSAMYLTKGAVITLSADYTVLEKHPSASEKVVILLEQNSGVTNLDISNAEIGVKHRISKTFVISNDGKYKRTTFSTHSSKVRVENVQWEIGAVASDFVPYKEQTLSASTTNGLPSIPVTSGGNYTDANGQQWICDEVDFERGVYVQRTVLVDNFIARVAHATTDQYTSEINTKLLGRSTKKSICTIMGKNAYAFNTEDTPHFYVDNYSACVFVPTGFDNSGNVIKVLAALTEPIETPLSETELAAYRALHTNKPNTTILNDSGAYMSVDYTADTKLYIDNKIKEALL